MALNVTPCNPYDARIGGPHLVRLDDGVSAFKVYYVDIVGRDNPSRYEWDKCPLGKDEWLARFRKAGWDGVGFITAFPHITKIFRFAPDCEILLHVAAYDTQTGAPIDLNRQGGYVEFACYAEALLAADEYRFWAEAETVEQYLALFSDCTAAPVDSNTKLAAYAADRG
jgi:hypothetical protein